MDQTLNRVVKCGRQLRTLAVATVVWLGFTATVQPTFAFELADYSSLLGVATKFYGAQRSGTATDNWIIAQYPAANRRACFPQDGVSYQSGLDLSGGWHDAGDNIKFTTTIAWAAYALLKSYDAYPAAHPDTYDRSYGGPNGIPDLLDEVKWATDYLMKIHIENGKLVSQIGDYTDHNQGLTCPTMTLNNTAKGGDPRKVWFGSSNTDYTQVKADVLGITAAALGLMGQLYAPYDATYAADCITHAEQLYATAKVRTGTTNEPAGQSYYKDNSYQDDLACAAIELHRATGTASYLTEAISASNAVGAHGWVVDWATHIDYCRHSIAVSGATGRSAVQNHWKSAVDSYRGRVSTNQYVNGLAFFSDWGSLRYALNSAFSAALYHSVYTDTQARDFAIGQLEWVMGTNSYNRSFVVGWGNNPPQRPHHKNAYGKDKWFVANDVSMYPLVGALVGGPHTNNYSDGSLTSPPGYQDIMTDYITNEVTIDYNTGLVGTAAFAVVQSGGGSSSSAVVSSSSVAPSSSSEEPSSSDATSLIEDWVQEDVGLSLVELNAEGIHLQWNSGALSVGESTVLAISLYNLHGHRIEARSIRVSASRPLQLQWRAPLRSGIYLVQVRGALQRQAWRLVVAE